LPLQETPQNVAASIDGEVSFGTFRLLAPQQLLLDGDRPVHIGARALDILITLVERAGELVTKDELLARAWPNLLVEEGNLRTQMAFLRKALRDGEAGARYVVTVPGRGYRFVAQISRVIERRAPIAETVATNALRRPPAPLIRVVGRADAVTEISNRLLRRRFITIVGPGGIGKTTVALAVTECQAGAYEHGMCFVDLAPLVDPLSTVSLMASALGLRTTSKDPLSELISFLRDKRILLVLDSCERVVETAAVLSEKLLKGAPDVHVLATSREPLRAEGESIYRLSPLAAPPASDRLTAVDAATFPAVELFVERAASIVDGFELSDAEAPIVADICRRLDGIALAIELAASRVGMLGLPGVAARLNDRFRLLSHGRRTAVPRHQTLEATLDWSYEILPPNERSTLRRLAVFPGRFALEAACAVAADDAFSTDEVIDIIDGLVSKSLVAVDVRGEIGIYRLLDTTRAYASQKLLDSGELEQAVRRHAAYFLDYFENPHVGGAAPPTTEWLVAASMLIDDIRAALNWAFSPTGDNNIGVALTVSVLSLWTHLSLHDECRKFVELAFSCAGVGTNGDARRDMQLYAALGASLIYTEGPGPKADEAWTSVLERAKKLGDIDYQLRALWGLFQVRFNSGQFRAALNIAESLRHVALTSTDPTDSLLGDRLVGLSHFYLGDYVNGRRHLESMLSRYVAPTNRSHIIRFQFDQRTVAQAILARILWPLGYPDRAMRMVDEMVDEARSTDHAMSLALGLAQACPVALWRGDLVAAESYIRMLVEHTTRHGLGLWQAWGNCFEGMLLIARDDLRDGLRILRSAIDRLPEHHMRYGGVYAYLAEALGRSGDVLAGLSVIEEALGRCEQDDERWHIAEFLRIRGELFRLKSESTAAQAAETSFFQSLDWARRQKVLSWELRTAMSLARLRQEQKRIDEARDLLAPILEQFQEGFETHDLRMAKGLMENLSSA
jgi:predicted ATPase/DNA-binding winged helix-turn-helix (wHTH) protein